MEYEDELDRMRARKRRNKSNGTGHIKKRTNSENKGHAFSDRGGRTYYSVGEGRNPRVRYTEQQNHSNHKGKKKRKRKHKGFLKVFFLVALLLVGFFFFQQRTHQKGFWTIAVFGVDSRDGNLEKGGLSDVVMVCNINKATGEIKLVSVYRDTYLKINKKGTYHKINEAYFKGGHKQGIEALNENLDLNIDDYATFNWKAVANGINILGGIDLEISDSEYAYINGFITETVNSTGVGSYQLKHAGMNHLDGVQAVAYARLRLMDTDFKRTERQRKVVNLAMEKAKNANFSTRKALISSVFPQISTSVGLKDLISIASGIKKYHIGETAGFPFSRTTKKMGRMDCVIATTLESNVIQLHQFLYDQENYIPSLSVKKISDSIAKESGITDPGKKSPSDSKSSGNSKKKSAQKKQEVLPQETEPVTEAATEETTIEETTIEVVPNTTQPDEAPTNEDGSLVGPGAKIEEREP
ncbi:LCP family protein [Clostridium sp. E02]|uniref:LCP family glycopolymer transferase n=1 Tax=Clostridium sp. E02 TaxID=2487134 RepID=UPI000F5428BF